MKILITGADRGLGYGTTLRLLERGHTVWAGQYLTAWNELSELQTRFPKTLHILELDVSDLDSVRAAAQLVGSQTDSLDMIINNAGISGRPIPRTGEPPEGGRPTREGGRPEHPEEGLEQDYHAIRAAYEVNALGPARVVECFLPLLKKSTFRRLCFVSSEAGSVTAAERFDMFGYCMSKAAVNMYVKILFNRLRPEGYSFRLYHPGWVRSYMGGVKSTFADLEPEEAGEYAVKHWFDETVDEDTLKLVDYTGKVWPF
jgi:NAD(P)-dependent dehydrogenase (short-subunit alcohol dehydrogenase family)